MEFSLERGASRKGCSSCDLCIAIHSGCHCHRLKLLLGLWINAVIS